MLLLFYPIRFRSFSIFSILYLNFSNPGDNFMGEIYRILFETSDDKNDRKKSSLILKIAPRNPFRRKMIPLRDIFLREIHMYDVVSQRTL